MSIDPRDITICATEAAGEAVPGGPAGPGGSRPLDRSESGAGPSRPVVPPIVQTSLFTFPTFRDLIEGLAAERRRPVYTRGRNPTVRAVERKLAALERGGDCVCFGSGMAAISAVMLGTLRAGDHVVFVNQVYGPTLQLARYLERFGVAHDVVLDLDPAAVRRALRPVTRLVWVESPGTMLMRVLDLPAVAAVAREHGALTCIDNSWATPLFQKPLELGADVVVHTCTKYLAGHGDLVAGAVVSSAERVEALFHGPLLLLGGILAPFDAWLLNRGLRTLPVRMRQHEADALRVAEFLAEHPAVRRVHHPTLSADPELLERQLSGTSGLLSFELARGDFESVRAVIDGLEVFRIGVSWGGVESLVLSPQRPEGDRPPEERLEARGLPRGLIRISVGLEGADLLIEDLDRALAAAA